jgi:hypothetical protein
MYCLVSTSLISRTDNKMPLMLGRAFGVAVPNHPIARSTSSYKEAGEMGFVSHSCPCLPPSGLSVPALMFRPSASLALANALASCSFRKVSASLRG